MGTLVNKLQQYQKKTGLTDKQFARKIGVSQFLWDKIQNGQRNITGDFMGMFFNAFPDTHDKFCPTWRKELTQKSGR
jgi:predicted transcriptional regulator